MKKIISMAVAGLMLATMAVPAFAAYQANADAESGNIKFDVQKIDTTWAADGVMSDREYYPVEVQDSWLSIATAIDDTIDGALNLKPTFAMSWDENYIYTYTQYNVTEWFNEWVGNEGNMWQGTAIQMNLADADCTGTDRLEYGVALDSATNDMISTIWNDYLGAYSEVPASDYYVGVNGTTVTYELRTPITAFSANSAASLGDIYAYTIVWAAGYVTGEHIHTQLGAGCTGDPGKNAELFARVTLVEAPPLPVVEEIVEEAPAAADDAAAATETPAAAQTSDSAVLFVLLAVAALGTAVIVTKKVRN